MNILALDDEEDVLKLLCRTIEACEPDAEIFSFTKSQEALDFAKNNHIDIAFLDIQISKYNGIEVAKKLKGYNHKVNIIFTTSFSEYAVEAIKIRSSGYIMKPVTKSDIELELSMLRHPVKYLNKKPYIKTFGNFELMINGKPATFKRTKSKELLAYLVDRNGSSVTRKEIASVLFEDKEYSRNIQSYVSQIIKSLKKTLKEYEIDDILYDIPNGYAINVDAIDCDLFDYLKGDAVAFNQFTGEYMTQYYWSEFSMKRLYE